MTTTKVPPEEIARLTFAEAFEVKKTTEAKREAWRAYQEADTANRLAIKAHHKAMAKAAGLLGHIIEYNKTLRGHTSFFSDRKKPDKVVKHRMHVDGMRERYGGYELFGPTLTVKNEIGQLIRERGYSEAFEDKGLSPIAAADKVTSDE